MTSEAFTIVYNKALDLVSRREHSRHELMQKLDKRYPETLPIIEEALEKLALNKILDDERFAEMYLNSRARKGFGPKKIEMELYSKKVDSVLISNAIEAYEYWTENAKNELKKKFKGSQPTDYKSKIRDGLTLLDQAIAHGNGALESDQVKALLGTIDQSYIIELVNHVALSDGDGAYLALNKITELNVEYEQVLKIIISVFHQISLHQQLQNSEDASIQQLAENLDPQIIQLHYEIALNALSKFHVHPHPKQALELCILRMLAFQPLSEGAAPKIEKKNSKLAAKSVAPSPRQVKAKEPAREEPKPVAASKGEDIIEESIEESSNMPSELDMQSWNSIFNSLNLSMFVSQVFSEFEFVSFTDSTLTLKKSDELINPTEGLKTEFLEAISSELGQKISLVIESGEVIASPAAIEVETAQKQLNDDKDALLENAAVKDILDSFGGKIIDESIKKVGP